MNNELPLGWTETLLNEVALWGSGGTPSRSNLSFFTGTIPWIKTGELGSKYIFNSEECISSKALENSSAKLFPVGSVCIAMYGATIGKLSILSIEAATNQACAVAQPISECLYNEFLYYFLMSEKENFINAGKGGAQPNISQFILKNWPIKLPPLNEQKRIVAKIEELFSELDKGLECLQKAQELLKVYRHLLLKNAFEGNLTQKWRKTVDCKLINANLDSLKNNFKNFPPPPPNWIWVTLDAIGDLICGQSPSISQVNYEGKGYLYVTGPEQWNGKEIKQTKWTEFPTRIAPSNSIFITVKGAGVGKLFPGTDCVIGRDIYAFCPFKSMNHKFVFYSLLYGINKVILKAKGDIPGLSKSHILDHTIGLPPLEEQNLIVEILESKFLSIKEIENELKDGTNQILLLRQSILKKAFSGELVHQNPNDEPAYASIERIKSEQLNHSISQTKSKKKQKVSI